MDHSTLNYYSQNFLKVAEEYESADVTQLHEFLSSSLKPGGKLLEFGCGSGRDAAFMVSQGFKVLATDGSASMIEQAKQHHPELAGHMVQLKLPDGWKNLCLKCNLQIVRTMISEDGLRRGGLSG